MWPWRGVGGAAGQASYPLAEGISCSEILLLMVLLPWRGNLSLR